MILHRLGNILIAVGSALILTLFMDWGGLASFAVVFYGIIFIIAGAFIKGADQ